MEEHRENNQESGVLWEEFALLYNRIAERLETGGMQAKQLARLIDLAVRLELEKE